jgi:hypothetical protein
VAIASSDIKFKLSIKTGVGGNDSAQADVDESLGKYISTTELSGTALNNLFDDITGDENAASDIEYRCIFIHNAHGSLTWQSPVIWLESEVANGASIAIAIDDLADSAIDSASAQADEVADESTAPGSGVGSFSSPTSKGTGLALGDIAAGFCKAVWVRRTAANNAALDNDGVTLRAEGDTAA